jgi:DNA repair and recombination protein RAD52
VDFFVTDDEGTEDVSTNDSGLPARGPNPPMPNPPVGQQASTRPAGPNNANGRPPPPQTPRLNGAQNQARPQQQNQNRPQPQQPPVAPDAAQGGGESVGFFSARAVNQLPEESLRNGVAPKAGQVFNPQAETPSIRRTPGIDHTKSKPVGRNGQHVAPDSSQSASAAPANSTSVAGPTTSGMTTRAAAAAGGTSLQPTQPAGAAGRGNLINPQLDQTRRIGAPGGPGSPLANRGQYRPPTVIGGKRPLGSDASGPATTSAAAVAAPARPPLGDVSNTPAGNTAVSTATPGVGQDVKRMKTA